ncbi:hypothetical protein CgunFtcFv8_014917 [Champsocephalus gunnari]|uniref:Uncharacterized protein n=1 Tax=Champsocephalus gunnari TaxID=52237 RepID=A0AAN8ICF8_CHAGU|nr:hypothetical protein CgunFtcFv8_014917 [Champsocephalus gunnari]
MLSYGSTCKDTSPLFCFLYDQHDQLLVCAEFVQRFECLSCGLTSLWVPSGASASDEEAGGDWRFTLEEMKETKVPIPR